MQDGDGARGAAVHGVPMYVALVDVCGGDEYLELIRSALQAALEAMPAGALFGLITFSTRVTATHCVACDSGLNSGVWGGVMHYPKLLHSSTSCR